jgi:hypothetical protein
VAAWIICALSNAGIVGSNPTQGMNVCVRLFCICVVPCVGSGLAKGLIPRSRSPTNCINLRNWSDRSVSRMPYARSGSNRNKDRYNSWLQVPIALSLIHTTACTKPSHSTVFSSRCLVATSNVDVPLTLGFWTVPMPQLPASNRNSSQRLNCSSLTNTNSPTQFTPLYSNALTNSQAGGHLTPTSYILI